MDGIQQLTDIQRFYKDSTVFITGTTGFIGKLVLEKVLRALPVKKVFILIRRKKDKSAAERVQKIIFESPAFDVIKRNQPDVLQKVVVMEGDCSLPMLGMSQEDQKLFIDEVDVILHVAANVRFDEHIKKITLTNVRGTRDLISLAKQIKKLKIFVYTGTGFSNCPRGDIKEEVYPSKISAEKLITACENLDEECLESMTKTLLGEWPNTYTFTKQVTEDYISREAKSIPICITRPAIVVSTMSEPLAAFVDNLYTLAGFVLANAMGFCRITYYKKINLDIIPADIVVNAGIAAGWQTGETFKQDNIETPVYNVSSVLDNPVTEDEVYDFCFKNAIKIPSTQVLFYPTPFRTTCRYNYLFLRMILHTMVANIFDFIYKIQGKEQRYAAAIKKLHKLQECNEFFTTKRLCLQVENTHKMLKKMSFEDKQLFNCDITTVNWENYFAQYAKGLRIYLLNDPMDTLPEGRKHFQYLKRVFIIVMVVVAIVLYVIGKFFLFTVIPAALALILYLLRCTIC